MPYSITIDDAFARSATAVGSGANSTTGLGNGWIDATGNLWNIPSSGHAAMANATNPPLDSAYRPAGENFADGRGRVWFIAGAGNSAGITARYTPASGGSGYTALMYVDRKIYVFKTTNGAAPTQIGAAFDMSATIADSQAVVLELVASGPNFTVNVYNQSDTTFSTVLSTMSFTDSTISTSGAWGTGGYGTSNVTRVQLATLAATLVAGVASSVFTGKTVAYASATAPTGGTSPYTYQWEISSNAGSTWTNVSGATSLTPRLTGLTANTAYQLRCKQTDSASAMVTTNAVSFTTLATTDHIYGLVADSIGVGALDAGGIANPTAFGAMLAGLVTAGHNCAGDNEAISGSASGDWIAGGGYLTGAIAGFVAHEVDIVLYMLGTNDSKTTVATTATAYDANMRNTVAELLNGHGIGKVILEQSPYPIPGTTGATWDSTSLTRLQSYQAKQAAFANGTTVLLGDTTAYAYFQAHQSELGSSGVHPLQTGYNSLGGMWTSSTRTDIYSTVSGVSVSPSAPTVAGGATQAFTATVSGTDLPSQAVTWSLVSGVGSINATTGVYTAPAATGSAQNAVIRATSVEDNTKSGTAAITISASGSPTVSGVSVSPSTATVAGLATQQFSATVAGIGSPSQSVNWGASAGSINSSGLFVAPAATSSPQTITITATSVADNTKSGTATVTVPAATSSGGGGGGSVRLVRGEYRLTANLGDIDGIVTAFVGDRFGIVFRLEDENGEPVPLGGSTQIIAATVTATGTVLSNAAATTLLYGAGGLLEYTLQVADTATAGREQITITLTDTATGEVQTFGPVTLRVRDR